MTRTMYDSVTAAHLPAGGDLYAAYVDGRYANVAAVQARFPTKKIVTITVLGNDADVCDVETGDLTPQSCVGWVQKQRSRGKDPTVYTMSSWWSQVRQSFHNANVPEPHYWIAQYDNHPVLMPGAVAKQYGGNVGGNYDISVVADFWPGIDSGVQPVGDDMIEYRIVTIPAPDASGLQLQSHDVNGQLLGKFNNDVVVSMKANDDGHPVRCSVEVFGYLGSIVCSFYREDGSAVPQGNVGIMLSHPPR